MELYWARDTQAIQQANQKYGRYCFSVAQHILEDRQDAEECVNDTWLHVWNEMPPHKPNMLRMFLAKIMRSTAFDRFKYRVAKKRNGGEMGPVLEEFAECIAEELAESVRNFLAALPQQERNLFL